MFSVGFFLASIRALGNPEFRDRFLRNPLYLERGTKITLASALISTSLSAVFVIFLTLNVLHIHSDQLESILGPVGGCLLLAAIFTTYYEYRRWKRKGNLQFLCCTQPLHREMGS